MTTTTKEQYPPRLGEDVLMMGTSGNPRVTKIKAGKLTVTVSGVGDFEVTQWARTRDDQYGKLCAVR